MSKEVYIVSAVRTPIGSFGGVFLHTPATQLGAVAIKGAVERAGLQPQQIEEVIFGNVLQANLGQAPARQAAKLAGLPDPVIATTVNKVCASGLKAVTLAAQSILTGDNDIVVAGGMENMSQAPFYVATNRWGSKFGHQQLTDGLEKDGLTDAYNGLAMGNCGEFCASEYHFSREAQDAYAIESYRRSADAWAAGRFAAEIVPVNVPVKKGEVSIEEDEEYKKVIVEKIPLLKPAFVDNGTLTAANSSNLNDGAAAIVLMSREQAEKLHIQPLAIIRGYADAEQSPELFPTTPSLAIPKALKKAGLSLDDIDYFELNEAYAVVALANAQILNISLDKVNVNGGAVALGHPLGCSGARIVVTLLHVLQQNNARYGVAAVCNGGGGASALVVEIVSN